MSLQRPCVFHQDSGHSQELEVENKRAEETLLWRVQATKETRLGRVRVAKETHLRSGQPTQFIWGGSGWPMKLILGGSGPPDCLPPCPLRNTHLLLDHPC